MNPPHASTAMRPSLLLIIALRPPARRWRPPSRADGPSRRPDRLARPAAPADPLNRRTPRDAMAGFLDATAT